MDIRPEHKLVAIEDDPEELVRTMDDRGITIVVSPEINPRPSNLQRQTRNSCVIRVKLALVYNRHAPLADWDVVVESNPVVENYVRAAIDKTAALTDVGRQTVRDRRRQALLGSSGQCAVERYRRLPLRAALDRL